MPAIESLIKRLEAWRIVEDATVSANTLAGDIQEAAKALRDMQSQIDDGLYKIQCWKQQADNAKALNAELSSRLVSVSQRLQELSGAYPEDNTYDELLELIGNEHMNEVAQLGERRETQHQSESRHSLQSTGGRRFNSVPHSSDDGGLET